MAALIFMILACLTEMEFPLEHYTLELQDHKVAYNESLSGKVAFLDEKTAVVTAVQLGQTNLIFVHKSILLFESWLPVYLSLSMLDMLLGKIICRMTIMLLHLFFICVIFNKEL